MLHVGEWGNGVDQLCWGLVTKQGFGVWFVLGTVRFLTKGCRHFNYNTRLIPLNHTKTFTNTQAYIYSAGSGHNQRNLIQLKI